MDSGVVTTPFGRRSISLALLAKQQSFGQPEANITCNKWKLFRAICEARSALGVTDRALTVLDALLSFYPKDELSSEHGLVVFPSNGQLSLRARGMAPATLRRHIAVLVETGLILRKDSPNGKRYARRNRAGEIGEAFGFSLAPLLARVREIEQLATRAITDRHMLRIAKDRLSVCRRDVSKLISAALNEQLAGDWESLSDQFNALVVKLPRTPTIDMLTSILLDMEALREHALSMLNSHAKEQKTSANESHIERHKQDSDSEFLPEFERSEFNMPRGQVERILVSAAVSTARPLIYAEACANHHHLDHQMTPRFSREHPQSKQRPAKFGLDTVCKACPEIGNYVPGGQLRDWRDLIAAANVARSTLAVSDSAYQEANAILGPQNVAVVVACILERGDHIGSPGGYLRSLTRRAARGEFALGPMLLACLRKTAPAAVHHQ